MELVQTYRFGGKSELEQETTLKARISKHTGKFKIEVINKNLKEDTFYRCVQVMDKEDLENFIKGLAYLKDTMK